MAPSFLGRPYLLASGALIFLKVPIAKAVRWRQGAASDPRQGPRQVKFIDTVEDWLELSIDS